MICSPFLTHASTTHIPQGLHDLTPNLKHSFHHETQLWYIPQGGQKQTSRQAGMRKINWFSFFNSFFSFYIFWICYIFKLVLGPGRYFKGFLEVFWLFLTESEPVSSYGDPKRINFYYFLARMICLKSSWFSKSSWLILKSERHQIFDPIWVWNRDLGDSGYLSRDLFEMKLSGGVLGTGEVIENTAALAVFKNYENNEFVFLCLGP